MYLQPWQLTITVRVSSANGSCRASEPLTLIGSASVRRVLRRLSTPSFPVLLTRPSADTETARKKPVVSKSYHHARVGDWSLLGKVLKTTLLTVGATAREQAVAGQRPAGYPQCLPRRRNLARGLLMSYVRKSLAAGESLVYATGVHWSVLFWPVVIAVIFVAGAIACLLERDPNFLY